MSVDIRTGDCLDVLASLPLQSVQCCITSPPYFGLRDYGMSGQIGLEPTPDEYVAKMVEVFRAVRRVLMVDGTLWLNLGDSYSTGGSGQNFSADHGSTAASTSRLGGFGHKKQPPIAGMLPKNLVGIPWRVAFALQADGWYLRSDIIWHKPNPMPESVTDRPTKAHEYLFLLAKSGRYFYDADAIAEPALNAGKVVRTNGNEGMDAGYDGHRTRDAFKRGVTVGDTRNRRTVWTVPSAPFSGAHFATFPPALIEPCILAGSKIGDTVLDPFGGAGTTGLVADRLQRHALLIELNPAYAQLARERIKGDAPLLTEIA